MFQLYKACLVKTNREAKKNYFEITLGIHYASSSIAVLLLIGRN